MKTKFRSNKSERAELRTVVEVSVETHRKAKIAAIQSNLKLTEFADMALSAFMANPANFGGIKTK